MPSFEIAESGVILSRLGLGTAMFGGADGSGGRGIQDDEVYISTIRRAVEHGINWIDTDAVLGLGHAERMVGRALADLPPSERPLVATGVGYDWDGRSRRMPPRQTSDPRRLRHQLQRSLVRLGLDGVDLVKLNVADGSPALFEDLWSALLDLKQSGLARAVGLVAPDSARLERAERIGACDAVFVELSLIDRHIVDSELLWRNRPRPAVVAYRTLAGGRLADRNGAANQTGGGRETEQVLAAALRVPIAAVAARRRSSVAAVATAWSLAWPGIVGAVVGAQCPEEVDNIADAARIELSVRDFFDIAARLCIHGEGRGPINPRRFAKAA